MACALTTSAVTNEKESEKVRGVSALARFEAFFTTKNTKLTKR
ncbi:MAG TPA: hypothetical protein VKC60_00405 [Opitutaceae bacterium]|nr:hypothetical protein [Opitutaceae bacterium]